MRGSAPILLALCLGGASAGWGAVDPGVSARPRTDFVAPRSGTYQLQRIQRAGDATLLESSGGAIPLSRYTRGKITLLTFFYSYCVDPLGCPFAQQVQRELRERLLAAPKLQGAVRFVSVSFDPTHDTPEVLRAYGAPLLRDGALEWRFLTARSVAQLLPLLDDFGQDVGVQTDEHGQPVRTLHHMLKMFLIDREGMVREIYTLAFLQPDVIFNDIETLALEGTRPATTIARSSSR